MLCCFSGMPLNILGLGAGTMLYHLIYVHSLYLQLAKSSTFEFVSEGGGCGVGVGLGWGFGTAYGSQYRSSRLTFQGTEIGKKNQSDGSEFKDVTLSANQVKASQ